MIEPVNLFLPNHTLEQHQIEMRTSSTSSTIKHRIARPFQTSSTETAVIKGTPTSGDVLTFNGQ